MWTRAELKRNAKQILKRNYWWIVVVTLIFGFATEGSTGISSSSSLRQRFNSVQQQSGILSDDTVDVDSGVFGMPSQDVGFSIEDGMRIFGEFWHKYGQVVLVVFFIIMIVAVLVSTFLLDPLEVGCRRWFIKNRKESPDISELGYVFSHGYMNMVKIMFCRDLFIFLWSLLFIIPGIIKSYEYRMVPYLLAENPEMDFHEAFERSKNMMYGNKGEAFVLDLSFIGWRFLATFTCGLLNFLYVSPYVCLTDTELYVALCGCGRVEPLNYNEVTATSEPDTE